MESLPGSGGFQPGFDSSSIFGTLLASVCLAPPGLPGFGVVLPVLGGVLAWVPLGSGLIRFVQYTDSHELFRARRPLK